MLEALDGPPDSAREHVSLLEEGLPRAPTRHLTSPRSPRCSTNTKRAVLLVGILAGVIIAIALAVEQSRKDDTPHK